MDLAEQNGLKVVEDCAQSHGASYKGRSVGSIGHIGAWSFCQDKIMTTGGEGGMVTTDDDALWRKMWSFKDHGKSYEAVYERKHSSGFRWLHESFGTNWRMTEMQASIGLIQLRRMEEWSAKRRVNAGMLFAALKPFATDTGPIRLSPFGCATTCLDPPERQSSPCECVHAYYKFYAYVQPENLIEGWDRDKIIEVINAEAVPCFQGSCSEIYLEKAFDHTSYRPAERLPNAKELGETSLMFLVHPTLTETEMSKTSAVLTRVLEQAAAS
jgi:dTDP-4-amino-4,6-dideoxygalactose transaminase